MELTLAKLSAPRVLEDKLQGDIAYLRVPRFGAGMTKQIREKLGPFKRQGVKKLILDLHDCNGDDGESNATAQLFCSSGTCTNAERADHQCQWYFRLRLRKWLGWQYGYRARLEWGPRGQRKSWAQRNFLGNKRGETVGDRTYGTASNAKADRDGRWLGADFDGGKLLHSRTTKKKFPRMEWPLPARFVPQSMK